MHGEPEDPANYTTGMSDLLFYISLKCCLEGLNGFLTKMLMTAFIVHLVVLVYYVRVTVSCMALMQSWKSSYSKPNMSTVEESDETLIPLGQYYVFALYSCI